MDFPNQYPILNQKVSKVKAIVPEWLLLSHQANQSGNTDNQTRGRQEQNPRNCNLDVGLWS